MIRHIILRTLLAPLRKMLSNTTKTKIDIAIDDLHTKWFNSRIRGLLRKIFDINVSHIPGLNFSRPYHCVPRGTRFCVVLPNIKMSITITYPSLIVDLFNKWVNIAQKRSRVHCISRGLLSNRCHRYKTECDDCKNQNRANIAAAVIFGTLSNLYLIDYVTADKVVSMIHDKYCNGHDETMEF